MIHMDPIQRVLVEGIGGKVNLQQTYKREKFIDLHEKVASLSLNSIAAGSLYY